MGIKQLNATYIAREDRILLRVSTEAKEEFRFWLTRPITGQFLAAVNRTQASALAKRYLPEVTPTVTAFEREALQAARSALDDKFVAGETLPLGETPRLVTKLTVTVKGEDVLLDFLLAKGPGVTLRLTRPLAQQVGNLVDGVQRSAGWALGQTEDFQQPAEGKAADVGSALPESKTIH
jgi:hypothetical protein